MREERDQAGYAQQLQQQYEYQQNQQNHQQHFSSNHHHHQQEPRIESRSLPFQTSTFFYPPQINAKNMSATYLRSDQQAIGNRPIPSNQAHNVFIPSGKTMVQVSTGKKRKLPTGDASASASQSNATASEVKYEEEEVYEEEEQESKSVFVNPASKTIVIHPGSHFTRIGRATDAYPLTIPTAIARRDDISGIARSQRAKPKRDRKGDASGANPLAELASQPSAFNWEDNQEGGEMEGELEDEMEVDEEERPKNVDPLSLKMDLLRADLRSIMRASRLRPVTNGVQSAANYNLDSKPQRIAEHNDLDSDGSMWTEEIKGNDFRIGEQAIRLPCFSKSHQEPQSSKAVKDWNLFRPFRSGLLDYETYKDRYGSPSAKNILLNDVRLIWEHAISAPTEESVQEAKAVQASSKKGGFGAAAAAASSEEIGSGVASYGLGIPSKEWSTYGVILIVPDLYSRSDCRSLVELLLSEMGFGAAFIQTESVAVTFGAGSSSTCVVRLGGSRSQVSCVDEGSVVAESRIALNYGGKDITTFFKELLIRSNLPYKDIDIEHNLTDESLLDEFKHRSNTLEIGQFGLNINSIMLRLPGQPTFQYSVRTYDEVVLAPMSLFNPRVIDFEEKRSNLPVLDRMEQEIDEESRDEANWDNSNWLDQVDAGVATVAMHSSVSHLLQPPPQPSMNQAADSSSAATQQAGAGHPQASDSHSGQQQPASSAMSANPSSSSISTPQALNSSFPQINVPWEASKVPLDVAIWNSLLATSKGGYSTGVAQDRVKRFASNIVCTGGSALIPGLAGALEARINSHFMNWHLSLGLDPNSPPYSTVVPAPRELDPRILAWKGMAVLARLDSVQEMWIRKNDWDRLGWRALKERTLFF